MQKFYTNKNKILFVSKRLTWKLPGGFRCFFNVRISPNMIYSVRKIAKIKKFLLDVCPIWQLFSNVTNSPNNVFKKGQILLTTRKFWKGQRLPEDLLSYTMQCKNLPYCFHNFDKPLLKLEPNKRERDQIWKGYEHPHKISLCIKKIDNKSSYNIEFLTKIGVVSLLFRLYK